MKQYFAVYALFVLCSLTEVLAQGTVVFGNAPTIIGLEPADRLVTFKNLNPDANSGFISRVNVSSNYSGLDLTGLRVALFFTQNGKTNLGEFSIARFADDFPSFRSSDSAVTGTWFMKTATLDGAQRGQTVDLVAVVWDSTLSPDPLSSAARVDGIWGASTPFQYTIPGSSMPHPVEFLPQGLRGFSVSWGGGSGYGVPEPPSLALLTLATAALVGYRRHLR